MSNDAKDPNKGKRRSSEWWGKADKDGFAHRSWMKNQGLPEDMFDGRPVIGIANTGSDLAPCNKIHVFLMDRIKAGIRAPGGIPMEFPVHPIQETGKRPTAMLDRNLAYLAEAGLDIIAHKAACLEDSDAYCITPPQFWFEFVRAMRNNGSKLQWSVRSGSGSACSSPAACA